jgi:hypothetical protein
MAAEINDSTPGAETQAAFETAVRAVLADRLNMVAPGETQERDVYALVRIRPDGPLGPARQRSAIDCEAMRAAGVAAAREGRPAPPALPLNTPERVALCVRDRYVLEAVPERVPPAVLRSKGHITARVSRRSRPGRAWLCRDDAAAGDALSRTRVRVL